MPSSKDQRNDLKAEPKTLQHFVGVIYVGTNPSSAPQDYENKQTSSNSTVKSTNTSKSGTSNNIQQTASARYKK